MALLTPRSHCEEQWQEDVGAEMRGKGKDIGTLDSTHQIPRENV